MSGPRPSPAERVLPELLEGGIPRRIKLPRQIEERGRALLVLFAASPTDEALRMVIRLRKGLNSATLPSGALNGPAFSFTPACCSASAIDLGCPSAGAALVAGFSTAGLSVAAFSAADARVLTSNAEAMRTRNRCMRVHFTPAEAGQAGRASLSRGLFLRAALTRFRHADLLPRQRAGRRRQGEPSPSADARSLTTSACRVPRGLGFDGAAIACATARWPQAPPPCPLARNLAARRAAKRG